MGFILDIIKLLVPVIITIITFTYNRYSAKTITVKNCYRSNYKHYFNTRFFSGISLILYLLLFSSLNYMLYKLLNHFDSQTVFDIHLLVIAVGCFIAKEIHNNLIKKNDLFDTLKHLLYHKKMKFNGILGMLVVSMFFTYGNELLKEENNFWGYYYLALTIISSVYIMYQTLGFFDEVEEVYRIRVILNDGSEFWCEEAFETKKNYIFKSYWKDYHTKKINCIEISKDQIKSLSINITLINLKEEYNKLKKYR